MALLLSRDFVRGFRTVIPLWLGFVPFSLAYAMTARGAGLGVLETQLLSALVFAGGAQFSAVGLFAVGASGVEIVLTTLLLNVRHLLYGLSLSQRLLLTGPEKWVAAHLLTDEAYGVVLAEPHPSFAYLMGAGLSVFVPWNLFTLVGALLGQGVPDPAGLGVDFVFPLAFLALLAPMLRGGVEVGVAMLSGSIAVGGSQVLPGGVALLLAGVVGSFVGACCTAERPERSNPTEPEAS
ncbi:AzlC family ABC transporter permease [Stigmatella sp. ncwal1]|uniref:AzlC family ABC transporter permease n=1 Tax=Stigmatella ashevillensis TaxID=2995309 RepID=A0ABT5DHF7_9BACT|nr:AzlC family ABC transporter permease [Stigmatella ashevillena]MDC0712565.1 AzlC family ABC transporter permease [Stigmatella ashevillena]